MSAWNKSSCRMRYPQGGGKRIYKMYSIRTEKSRKKYKNSRKRTKKAKEFEPLLILDGLSGKMGKKQPVMNLFSDMGFLLSIFIHEPELIFAVRHLFYCIQN